MVLLFAGLVWLACGDSPTEPLAQRTIGPSGGELRADGVVLAVPAGALPSETRITVERASPSQLPSSVGARADSIVPGTLYDFGPDGLVFDAPATLTLEYDPAHLPPGSLETWLRVVRIGDTVEVVPGVSVDTAANTVAVQVDHFTFFGVYGPIEPRPLLIEVRENVGVVDQVGPDAPGLAGLDLADSVQVSDVVTVTAPGVVSIEVAEAVGVSDALSATAYEGSIAVGEGVSISDLVEVTAVPGATLYVVSAAGSLEVFDAAGPTPIASIPLPATSSAIARRPGTDELWVTERTTDSVSVVDARTNTVAGRFYSSALDPFTVDFDGVGSLGVIGDNDVGRLSVLAGSTGALDGFVQNLASRVVAAEVSSDGSTAWTAGSQLTRVDLVNRVPVDSSAAGAVTFASDLDLTPDESELWATDGIGGVIVVFDPTDLAVLDSIPVSAGSSTGGEHLAFSSDGTTAFATTSGAGEIVVIDVASRAELTRYATGGPITELVHDADRNRIYGTSPVTSELIVFDLGTGSLIDRVTVPSPRELTIQP